MYGHFIQFTIPKIGQALVAVVLYLNLLKLPFVKIETWDVRNPSKKLINGSFPSSAAQ